MFDGFALADAVGAQDDAARSDRKIRTLLMERTTRLTVGAIEGQSALLNTEYLDVVRLPLALLPDGVKVGAFAVCAFFCRQLLTVIVALFAGHVIDLSTCRSATAEQQREHEIRSVQAELQARLGPSPVGTIAGQHGDVLSS